MHPPVSYHLRGQQFWLSGQRCLYWEAQQLLILSDLHFGKTGHFRKEGIAVPAEVFQEDMMRLWHQIQFFGPKKVAFVGDLFHSRMNLEVDWFRKWRNDLPMVEMHLVAGNHDVLGAQVYEELGLIWHRNDWLVEDIRFVHDTPEHFEANQYVISGHVHPGVRLAGMGRQSLRFPCFYFNTQFAILPAFSRFTGLALIEPKKQEDVFAIVNDQVIPVS